MFVETRFSSPPSRSSDGAPKLSRNDVTQVLHIEVPRPKLFEIYYHTNYEGDCRCRKCLGKSDTLNLSDDWIHHTLVHPPNLPCQTNTCNMPRVRYFCGLHSGHLIRWFNRRYSSQVMTCLVRGSYRSIIDEQAPCGVY